MRLSHLSPTFALLALLFLQQLAVDHALARIGSDPEEVAGSGRRLDEPREAMPADAGCEVPALRAVGVQPERSRGALRRA